MIHELAALGAALCWAATGMMAPWPVSRLGPFAFNRWRQIFAGLVLGAIVLASGTWPAFDLRDLSLLALSGLAGVLLGDSLLFTAIHRLGPRRAGVIFALNAPIAAGLGWLFLGETLSLQACLGVGLCAGGVALAIRFGGGRAPRDWEPVRGAFGFGLAAGLGAALGQALGALIARPVMAAGFDPFAASFLRVGVAAFGMVALSRLPAIAAYQIAPITPRVAAATAATALVGLGGGLTLLLFALTGGKVGVVSTLAATSPVMILPMIWAVSGRRPAPAAWAGAALVVAGAGLLFAR
jgi:drug/metabolite transporter (DMT)-like permease